MAKHINSTQSTLIAALSTLSPPHISLLTRSISSVFHRNRCRLSALLSSPILFSLTIRYLRSLSLHQKSLLIARHIHSTLSLLEHFTRNPTAPPPPQHMKIRDLDAALLLLFLCEIRQHDPNLLHAPPFRWRVVLIDYLFRSILSISRFGVFSDTDILVEYIDSVGRCWNFVSSTGFGGNEGGEVAAAAEVVVALPSVEVSGGPECVICTEEMRKGREVCELPCGHFFHWICILQWLKKRNTCPCCRHRLPTADVHREIERLMDDFARVGGADLGSGRLYRECL